MVIVTLREIENIRRKKEEEDRRVEEREEWEDENKSKNKLIIVMFSPITQRITYASWKKDCNRLHCW